MNKQLVAATTAIAMIASSCASTMKNDSRWVAGQSTTAPAPEVVEIANQVVAKAKGGKYDFTSANLFVRNLTDSDMKKYASAYDVKLLAGQVMTDNDVAFNQKLRVIESAKKELRMVYFIYADDDSSSKLNSALLKKANEGVDVSLMVDFITNYKNLDLFIALNKQSGGKIKVYFYNFPSQQVLQDANYITLPCPAIKAGETPKPDACYQEKMASLQGMKAQTGGKVVPTSYAKLFLTGLYGKSATAIKIALGYGAQINPADYKDKKGEVEDGQAVLELAKTVKEAFFDGSIIAKIKLSIAMSMYGEKINPILNEVTGRLPIRDIADPDSKDKARSSHGAIWDHITDYTHHKLILADKEQFVLGGRNVEDSYHMKHRVGSAGKYIFMDTDFWGQTAPGGAADIATSFDKMRKSSMVASLDYVKDNLAYDFLANMGTKDKPGATEMAIANCAPTAAQGADVGQCILDTIPKMNGYQSEDARVKGTIEAMAASYKNYQDNYKPDSQDQRFGRLSPADMRTATFFYLENSNVNKAGQRVTGSKIGYEADNNKNIQATWFRALENVCKVSQQTETDKRVIFHTAYLLMPSGLTHTIAQMMNGDFGDCSRVKITFLTNSPFTTDLAPINVLARYQLGALFDHYAQLQQVKAQFETPGMVSNGETGANGKVMQFKYKQFWPQMEYYEYTPADSDALAALTKKPDSLHTKTTLIGDDLIVGSANADIRSYIMDTNNAMMIRNAHEMNAQYITFVDGLIASGRVKNRLANFQGRGYDQLNEENHMFLEASAKRWHQEKRLDSNFAKEILNYIDKAGRNVYETTKALLVYRGEFEQARLQQGDGAGDHGASINGDLNKKANAMDDMFKVF